MAAPLEMKMAAGCNVSIVGVERLLRIRIRRNNNQQRQSYYKHVK